jgi:Exostosin family.
MKILQIPKQFQPRNRVKYPPHNDMVLEEYVFDAIKNMSIKTRLAYLPVFWTTYYCCHKYGQDKIAVQHIKDFCSTVKEPWFTVSQFDCGILFKHQEMPVEFVSMSAGGEGDEILPLSSYAWPDSDIRPPQKYIASFIGYKAIHPIRKKMFDLLQDLEGFYIEDASNKPYYKDVMLQSRYALCPRGCGKTSFRLYEAMQMGTEPIYLSDEPWLPENLKGIITVISSAGIENLKNLGTVPETPERSDYFKNIWREYGSYEGCVKTVIKILEEKYHL